MALVVLEISLSLLSAQSSFRDMESIKTGGVFVTVVIPPLRLLADGEIKSLIGVIRTISGVNDDIFYLLCSTQLQKKC